MKVNFLIFITFEINKEINSLIAPKQSILTEKIRIHPIKPVFMKMIKLMLLVFAFFACTKDYIKDESKCMNKMIIDYNKTSKPIEEVWKYDYRGSTIFYIEPQGFYISSDCEIISTLFSVDIDEQRIDIERNKTNGILIYKKGEKR